MGIEDNEQFSEFIEELKIACQGVLADGVIEDIIFDMDGDEEDILDGIFAALMLAGIEDPTEFFTDHDIIMPYVLHEGSGY